MLFNRFNLISFFLLSLLVAFIYSSGLSAPFYLDDYSSISENPAIVSANWPEIWELYKTRFVGYASFAINTQYSDGTATSFRLINIAIHAVNSFLVFLLVRTLLGLNEKSPSKPTLYTALLLAAVFAAHPLQTGAVTYIVQRLASLAALFFLLSTLTYLVARIKRSYPLLVVSIICFFCAFLTKQNAITLIGVLFLCETLVLRKMGTKALILGVGVTIGAALLVSVSLIVFDIDIALIDKLTRETETITRADYFYVQLAVIGHYLSIFVVPSNLMLDYGMTVETWQYKQNIWWGFFHALALVSACVLSKTRPLVALGILFYYVTHSVESSFLPIRDVIFEHRSYLPNVGLLIFLAPLIHKLFCKERTHTKAISCVLSLIVVSGLGKMTYDRNSEWADSERFFVSEIKRNGGFWRSRNELAAILINQGKLNDAAALLDIQSISLNSHPALIVNAFNLLIQTKQLNHALALHSLVEEKMLDSHIRYQSRFYSLSGSLFMNLNQLPLAIDYFKNALEINPNYLEALVNQGIALALMGKYDEARESLNRAKLIASKLDRERISNNLKVVDSLEERKKSSTN